MVGSEGVTADPVTGPQITSQTLKDNLISALHALADHPRFAANPLLRSEILKKADDVAVDPPETISNKIGFYVDTARGKQASSIMADDLQRRIGNSEKQILKDYDSEVFHMVRDGLKPIATKGAFAVNSRQDARKKLNELIAQSGATLPPHVTQAVQEIEKDNKLDSPKLAQVLVLIGNALDDDPQTRSKALPFYLNAIGHDLANPDARIEAASLFLENGQIANAHQIISTTSIKNTPENASDLKKLAELKQDFEKVISNATAAANIDFMNQAVVSTADLVENSLRVRATPVSLPRVQIGPRSQGRNYGVIARTQGLQLSRNDENYLGDFSLALAAWMDVAARTDAHSFNLFMPMGNGETTWMLGSARYKGQGGLGTIGLANVILIPTHIVMNGIPASEIQRLLNKIDEDFEIMDDAERVKPVMVTPGLAEQTPDPTFDLLGYGLQGHRLSIETTGVEKDTLDLRTNIMNNPHAPAMLSWLDTASLQRNGSFIPGSANLVIHHDADQPTYSGFQRVRYANGEILTASIPLPKPPAIDIVSAAQAEEQPEPLQADDVVIRLSDTMLADPDINPAGGINPLTTQNVSTPADPGNNDEGTMDTLDQAPHEGLAFLTAGIRDQIVDLRDRNVGSEAELAALEQALGEASSLQNLKAVSQDVVALMEGPENVADFFKREGDALNELLTRVDGSLLAIMDGEAPEMDREDAADTIETLLLRNNIDSDSDIDQFIRNLREGSGDLTANEYANALTTIAMNIEEIDIGAAEQFYAHALHATPDNLIIRNKLVKNLLDERKFATAKHFIDSCPDLTLQNPMHVSIWERTKADFADDYQKTQWLYDLCVSDASPGLAHDPDVLRVVGAVAAISDAGSTGARSDAAVAPTLDVTDPFVQEGIADIRRLLQPEDGEDAPAAGSDIHEITLAPSLNELDALGDGGDIDFSFGNDGDGADAPAGDPVDNRPVQNVDDMSMEEILASIRQIITEGDAPAAPPEAIVNDPSAAEPTQKEILAAVRRGAELAAPQDDGVAAPAQRDAVSGDSPYQEPTLEEILANIRRIISEEDALAAPAAAAVADPDAPETAAPTSTGNTNPVDETLSDEQLLQNLKEKARDLITRDNQGVHIGTNLIDKRMALFWIDNSRNLAELKIALSSFDVYDLHLKSKLREIYEEANNRTTQVNVDLVAAAGSLNAEEVTADGAGTDARVVQDAAPLQTITASVVSLPEPVPATTPPVVIAPVAPLPEPAAVVPVVKDDGSDIIGNLNAEEDGLAEAWLTQIGYVPPVTAPTLAVPLKPPSAMQIARANALHQIATLKKLAPTLESDIGLMNVVDGLEDARSDEEIETALKVFGDLKRLRPDVGSFVEYSFDALDTTLSATVNRKNLRAQVADIVASVSLRDKAKIKEQLTALGKSGDARTSSDATYVIANEVAKSYKSGNFIPRGKVNALLALALSHDPTNLKVRAALVKNLLSGNGFAGANLATAQKLVEAVNDADIKWNERGNWIPLKAEVARLVKANTPLTEIVTTVAVPAASDGFRGNSAVAKGFSSGGMTASFSGKPLDFSNIGTNTLARVNQPVAETPVKAVVKTGPSSPYKEEVLALLQDAEAFLPDGQAVDMEAFIAAIEEASWKSDAQLFADTLGQVVFKSPRAEFKRVALATKTPGALSIDGNYILDVAGRFEAVANDDEKEEIGRLYDIAIEKLESELG